MVRLGLQTPVSFVSIVAEDWQVLWGQRGMPEPWCSIGETPLSYSFCQYVVASNATLVVEDAAAHPIGAQNFAVQDLGLAAYLGTPIRTPDGHVVGALSAIDSEPRSWTRQDIEMLGAIAEGVAKEVAVRYPCKGAPTTLVAAG